MMRGVAVAFLSAAVLLLSACGPKMIPGTDIQDTDQNHEILSVIAKYREALEARNVDVILSLVSPGFFETSGTVEPGDDYNFQGLQQKLLDWANTVKAARVSIQVKTITVEQGVARAQYFYDVNYQIPGPDNVPLWKRESDTKEMVLRREGNTWKIMSGI